MGTSSARWKVHGHRGMHSAYNDEVCERENELILPFLTTRWTRHLKATTVDSRYIATFYILSFIRSYIFKLTQFIKSQICIHSNFENVYNSS